LIRPDESNHWKHHSQLIFRDARSDQAADDRPHVIVALERRRA
jgi:hypothetical protein